VSVTTSPSPLAEMGHDVFRDFVRGWLVDHATLRVERESNIADEYDLDRVGAAKEFQKELHAAGLAGLTWPAAAGGCGLAASYEVIYQRECSDYDMPTSIFNVGTGMCGPTIAAHGTDEQQARWLRAILTGADIWCQLFSEPDAGSDLAAVRSLATRAPGGWRVNGQKIWTSHGRFSDFGLALLRSDLTRPKHQGLMVAVVDMAADGVTVRPLRQMTGLSKFDQVFLDDVFIPDSDVLGDEHDGWRITRTTLSNERVAVGGNTAFRGGTYAEVLADSRASGTVDDPAMRQRLAAVWTSEVIITLMRERARRAVLSGRAPGPEGALNKLASSRFVREVSALGLMSRGGGPVAWSSEHGREGLWAARMCAAPGLAVGGGTDEIVASIVAERVLGLPREPKLAVPEK
jgi:alkylation response protein AidB-like acyl-CoA dehydrogenase